MHSERRERELLRACSDAYLQGIYEIEDFEHDIARVLRGELPERCDNWSPYEAFELETIYE